MIGAWTHWLRRYDARARTRALAIGSMAGPKPQVSVFIVRIAERVLERIQWFEIPTPGGIPGVTSRVHTTPEEIKFLLPRTVSGVGLLRGGCR